MKLRSPSPLPSQVWLNRPDVQAALHARLVGKASFDFSTGLRYAFTAHSLLAAYNATLLPALRVLQVTYYY